MILTMFSKVGIPLSSTPVHGFMSLVIAKTASRECKLLKHFISLVSFSTFIQFISFCLLSKPRKREIPKKEGKKKKKD